MDRTNHSNGTSSSTAGSLPVGPGSTVHPRSTAEPRVLALKMHYEFMKNYSYLAVAPGSLEAVIVDPAWEMEKVEQALTETGSRLRGVLVTHAHPDHVHLARAIADLHECPIWMSKEEIEASGFRARQLEGIEEGRLRAGEMTIEAILTPGHTPGCMCYLAGDNLFTGDVLFAEGCGMCSDAAAAHAMYNSLKKLKSRLKPHTRIFPGHSYGTPPGQTLSHLLRENIYLQFSNPHTFAAFRLRSGQDRSKMFNFS